MIDNGNGNACFTVNRKKGIFRIYRKNAFLDYPLPLVQEFKSMNDLTYQDVANSLLDMYEIDQVQHSLDI